MRLRTVSRSSLAVCGVLALVVAGAAGAAVVSASSRASGPVSFAWLVPAPPPSGWKHLSLPSGGGILFYPPSLCDRSRETRRPCLRPTGLGAAIFSPT